MPSNKSSKKTAVSDDLDLDALFASQQSSSSETDESAMMVMMAKKLQEAAEKKAKERDTRLVQAFNTESKKLIVSRVAEVTAVITEIGEEQEALAKADAENEDALRALWTEIARLREQQKAVMLRRAEAQRQIDQQRRKANISSLTQISRACQDAVKVTDNLGS